MRQVNRLTGRTVETLTKRGLHHDGRGLYLRIGPTGAKSWVLRYTGIDGKRHDLGLGSTYTVTLAEARDLALNRHRERKAGIDPIAAKRTAIAEQRAAEARNITFEQCAVQYLDAQRSRWKSNEGDIWRARLRDYVYPVIGDLPVAMIDLPLVLKILKPRWETMASMAKIRGYLESILAYAAVHGFRSSDNPARWANNLSVVLPSRSKTAQQDHFAALPHGEIAAYMADVRKVDKIGARALEFTILTAARRGEVLGARWQEVDFQASLWTVPASRMKMGKEHIVPLSDAALALLDALPRRGALIFPMGPDAMHNVAKSLRDGVTVHGFRSCFRDWAGDETGFDRVDVELCLAHSAGDATEQAYRRSTAVAKRARIMSEWAKYCDAPSLPASTSVHYLHSANA
jgi:integrase